jgi:hypothetical protein
MIFGSSTLAQRVAGRPRPAAVCFGEEAGDLAPAGPFAGLARFTGEDKEEIETVARGTDTAVRRWANDVAEGSQELEEDGRRVGFSVWGEATNDAASDTVESRDGYCEWWGCGKSLTTSERIPAFGVPLHALSC